MALVRRQEQAKKKSRQQAKPTGHLVDKLVVWGDGERYVARLLEERVPEPVEGHRRFLSHLIASGSGHPQRAFVPVSYKLLRPLHPSWNAKDVWAPLATAGLIERQPEDRHARLSAEYRLTEEVATGLARRAPRTAEAAAASRRANLVTGTTSVAVDKSSPNDHNGKPYPPLIRSALTTIDRGLFYAPAVEAHLDDLREQASRARAAWVAVGRPKEGPEHERMVEAVGRLRNDEAAYDTVLAQGLASAGAPGVYSYHVAYGVATTGRVIQIGRGLQSCTKRMKAAAYSGVPNARNYDFQACHIHFLIELLEDAGIDASWFVEFADAPGARAEWARAADLPVGIFKACVHACVNGAALVRDPHESESEIVKLVWKAVDDVDYPWFSFMAKWQGLRRVLRPIRSPLKAWHRHLLGDYAAAHRGKGRGGAFIRNAVGMRFYPAAFTAEERPRKLAAFVLQGYEAALVHTLTGLSTAYGFEPISNEHDGLVTIGEVPDAAVDEAKKRIGVTRSRLLTKPLCSDDDREALRACCRRAGFDLPEGP